MLRPVFATFIGGKKGTDREHTVHGVDKPKGEMADTSMDFQGKGLTLTVDFQIP